MHRGENALHLGGSFWSLASKQPSGIWRKKCCQKSGTVRLTKGRAHRNLHQKRSPVVSLSTKRVTLLSPTFLKKGMSSPIAKFAHRGITGRSIEPVFALVLVTGMQGRGSSALEWPPSPCSALNECDLCRKNVFSTWIQELCVLSISALCCKVCPLTQGVHCQPHGELFLRCVFVSSFPKTEMKIFLFYLCKTLQRFWMDSALGDFSITVVVNNVVSLSPNIEDKYFWGVSEWERKVKLPI